MQIAEAIHLCMPVFPFMQGWEHWNVDWRGGWHVLLAISSIRPLGPFSQGWHSELLCLNISQRFT